MTYLYIAGSDQPGVLLPLTELISPLLTISSMFWREICHVASTSRGGSIYWETVWRRSISIEYKPDAFATSQRITGQMLSEINQILQEVVVDTRQNGDGSQIDRALSQVQITKTDVSQLSGIREALNLTKLETALRPLNVEPLAKQRLIESIIESYQQVTGRNWKTMIYYEKDALEKLRAWAKP